MHLPKIPKPPARRLMRLADQFSLCLLAVSISALPASAASGTTVWSKASEIMQDVYTQIVSISTITAVVCASVALLLMNFFQKRPHGGRQPRLAQAHRHHLGYPHPHLQTGYYHRRGSARR